MEGKKQIRVKLVTVISIIMVLILLGGIAYLTIANIKLKKEINKNVEKTNIIPSQSINSTLPKIEENEELKNFLGYIGHLNTYKDNNYQNENISKEDFLINEKIMISSMFTSLERKNDYVTYNLDEIKIAAEEIFDEEIDIRNAINLKKTQIFYDPSIEAYIDGGGDESYSVYLVKIENQTNSNGIYEITFLYGYPSEGDMIDNQYGENDCYRTTIKLKVNNNYKYSKYQLVDQNLESQIVGKMKDFDNNLKSENSQENTQSNRTSISREELAGKYEREKTHVTEGSLEISKVTENSFEFSIECLYGTQNEYGPNIGTLEGTAILENNKYVYYKNDRTLGYEYRLYFEFSKEAGTIKIKLKDEGQDEDGAIIDSYPESGHNVDFDGEYIKR